MVKFYALLLILPILLFGQKVVITAEMNDPSYTGMPLKGTITVTHDRNLKVESFSMDGKPLKAIFQKDVVMSSDSPLVVSIYDFEMEPQKKGLQILPEIKAVVAGNTYLSTPSTYTVQEPATNGKVILRLEPFVEPEKNIYPGQRIKVGYRYFYNYNFDLTKEQIPLLEAKGFIKIGDRVLKESTREGLTTLEVSLTIEAILPGTYTFGPSLIEGRAYKEDVYGGKQFSKSDYVANAPDVTIKVDPFPEMGKPPSFKGAIGEYTIDVTLLSSPEVTVGDKITFQIVISGTGAIENIQMPDICCQPGFSGFFKQSDLPAQEQVEGNKKIFTVEMRPVSDSIQEIPPLEFSFFNPVNGTYSMVKSKSISLDVLPLDRSEKISNSAPDKPEIEGDYPLVEDDLFNLKFGTWWSLAIVPFGLLFLILRKNQSNRVTVKTSQEILREALKAPLGSSKQYNGIREAFASRLDDPQVKNLLARMEEVRFSGNKELSIQSILVEAKRLLEEK